MEKENYPEWYVDAKSICPNWDTSDFLKFMDLELEDCTGKNITSIWWWFGIFEMDASKAWAIMTAVDPIFSDKKVLNIKLQENIDWLDEKTNWKSRDLVERLRLEVAKSLTETKTKQDYEEVLERLKRYDERKEEVDSYILKRKEQINHLKNWQSNQEKYGLILNSSSWDNIQWIDRDSQDIVLIAHTLSHIYKKPDWNIINFLSEALKILKSDWKLYIIDYVWDAPEMEKVLEKTKLKKYYRENKWSFVCCFDKKWLDKFLEDEMK